MMLLVNLLLFLVITVGIIGLVVAVWSIRDTRNRYYGEFLRRKNRRAGD